jgi:hypothetical protein
MTTSTPSGMSTSTSRRLCAVAPRISIVHYSDDPSQFPNFRPLGRELDQRSSVTTFRDTTRTCGRSAALVGLSPGLARTRLFMLCCAKFPYLSFDLYQLLTRASSRSASSVRPRGWGRRVACGRRSMGPRPRQPLARDWRVAWNRPAASRLSSHRRICVESPRSRRTAGWPWCRPHCRRRRGTSPRWPRPTVYGPGRRPPAAAARCRPRLYAGIASRHHAARSGS